MSSHRCVRNISRIGLGFVGDHSCSNMISYTRMAEQLGYESVWVSEDLGFRDAIAPLASLAMSTERIKLATGILPIYYRNPALVAMTIATLDEISEKRIILGLGSGVRSYVERQGIEFREPLIAIEEYVEIVRGLLAGESITYRGQVHNITETRLSFAPLRRDIPVYVAARGPKMFQMAGRIANGALMSDGFCSASYVAWALENIEMGVEVADRCLEDVDLASFVILSVSADHDVAKERAKPTVLSLLSEGVLGPHLRTMGLSSENVIPIRQTWLRGNRREAEEKVSDTLIDACAIYGTPDECAQKMKRFRDAGVNLPIIIPVETDMRETIELARDW